MATSQEKVLALASKDEYRKVPGTYNGLGRTKEPHCEDVMEIYLDVNPRQMVVDAGYTLTEGACLPVAACAAAAVELIKDKPVLEVYTITKDQIAALVTDDGSLDQEHVHCAMMAELTLKKAVLDYVKKSQFKEVRLQRH